MAFRNESYSIASLDYVLSQIPIIKLHNYGFRNNGNITFSNVTDDWGLTTPSFSNGAAYADLDNDGDMDMVINNINDKAFIYKNTLMNSKENTSHYLSIKLVGDSLNRNGLGTWIELYYGSHKQVIELTPYRGYLSSVQTDSHFGLGNVLKIDSVVIKWPDYKKQVLLNVATNQTIIANHKNANNTYNRNQSVFAKNTTFKDITDSVGIQYQHNGKDFVDFNIQKLLPHKFSEYDPALAAGDINGDGIDDIVVGGSATNSAALLLQRKNGSFIQKNFLLKKNSLAGKIWG